MAVVLLSVEYFCPSAISKFIQLFHSFNLSTGMMYECKDYAFLFPKQSL